VEAGDKLGGSQQDLAMKPILRTIADLLLDLLIDLIDEICEIFGTEVVGYFLEAFEILFHD
jgi:hypothetical protein